MYALFSWKKFILCFFTFLLLTSIGTLAVKIAYSQSSNATEIQNRINDLKSKISFLQSQSKSLSSQIAIMNNQIKLTEARIEANKKEIVDLTLDIDTTSKKISSLQESLDVLTGVLLHRIISTYEVGKVEPLQMVLSSKDISNLLLKLNYLKIVQAHDKKLVYEVQQSKNDYSNQKEIFEEKKKRVEALKLQLERYNTQLSQEKADKNALLVVTKNSEVSYQQQLQAALAEQAAINKITSGGGSAVFAGKVKEGDLIGYVISGKSACSSGTHLHFEVAKDNVIQDPSGYLGGKSISFENSPDGSFSFGGSWRWPLNDPIHITQGYGMTYWARIGWYGGGPHTGIDMYSSSSTSVYAVKDGDLYRGGISCGGGQLLFSRVEQADGMKTYYLHIVSSL